MAEEQQEQEQSTAVSTEVKGVGQLQELGRRQGMIRREVNELALSIAGMAFGDVLGSNLSEATRWQIARFCHITRANPLIHIDIFGSRPYHNVEYWRDLLTTHEYYVDYRQRDISPIAEEALRERGKRHREVADGLEADNPEKAIRLGKAIDLEDQADDFPMLRGHYNVPKWATAVCETTIRRFLNATPIDKVKSGEITDLTPWIIEISECNYAGGKGSDHGKKDPVGDGSPGKTSRSRSFRRCGNSAFSAWMEPLEEEIRKAEQIIEAEFTIIQNGQAEHAASLPDADGPQAVTTLEGEPVATNPTGAQELPLADESDDDRRAREQAAAEALDTPPVPEPQPEEPDFDQTDARKRFFATLRDASVPEDARKAWCRDHGLPESTKEFSKESFERAQSILVGPVKDEVLKKCEELVVDLGDLSLTLIKKERPDYLRDWKTLAVALAARSRTAESEEL